MLASSRSTFVRGACPHDCPDTCATIVEVKDGRAVRFTADPAHPITQGWLCAKVRPYLDRVYAPDRLTVPLRRIGAKGSDQWQTISWDEAIAEIADRWQAIIAEHGAAAILPYSFSGTLGLVQLEICNQRLWRRMGASGLRRSICGAAGTTAINATLGAQRAPDPRDIPHSKMMVIWGHNPASTSPHSVPFLREAQRNGAHVVVIDPRRTLSARSADEHVRPNPATDGALALGMMHVIFNEGLHDEAWLRQHAIGWEALRDRTADYPPHRVAQITGVPAETILRLARRFATTKPALLKLADGIQRHGNGGQTVRALASLAAIVGQIGVRGGGIFYSTSGYVKWDRETVSHSSQSPPTPRTVNMNRLGAALTGEMTCPPIKSLYVFCANPVAASPNAGLIVEGMQRDDLFTVVHEQFMTDTARYADIVLPATTQLEQTDFHLPYGNRQLLYNQAAIAPLGEAKSNWDVMGLLASAMGYHEPWLHQTPDQIIAELLDASRPSNTCLTGITLERLQDEGSVPLYFAEGDDVPFANGRFPTPSGKVELYSQKMAELGLDPLPDFQLPAEFRRDRQNGHGIGDADERLILLSGAPHHFVTTSMANQPKLMAKEGLPFVEINPLDAARRGIEDNETVSVENARGSCELRAVVTDDVPSGVAVAPKGRWASLSPDGRNINWTTPDALGDLAGQSTYHSNLVEIRPVRLNERTIASHLASDGADRVMVEVVTT